MKKKLTLIYLLVFGLFNCYGQEKVFTDRMPEFKGGTKAMFEFIEKNNEFKSLLKEHTKDKKYFDFEKPIYVKFTIDSLGRVLDSTVSVTQGIHKTLDEEAIRIVKEFPDFNPAQSKGKPVKIEYVLPFILKNYK